ncbi:hypothetical protein TWF506_006251 [Arthrobotrys conoides]|uniref:Dynamin N-terminal domain-containing protein n=1 Tax=Arthrobotrys conoides TaxID=74498 RepID=A0AAN8NT55_9PEZI
MATILHQGSEVQKRDPEAIDECLRKLTEKGQRFLQLCANQLERIKELNVLSEDGSELLQSIPTYAYGSSESGSKATIAFVGETGEGKSTLLNALLNCGEIAPTSGSSACTCVATEFSSRTSNMQSKYHAIVEYISQKDFEEELQILCQEIQDRGGTIDYGEGEGFDATMENQETGSQYTMDETSIQSYDAAIEKLKALFPGFEERDLPGISEKVKALYETEPLKSGKRVIERDDDTEFIDEVSKVVSAKSGGCGDEPELWPLVKVVKIYLDSEVLQTGAILVDLPGIQDTNAARTGVANEYLEKAEHVIIVSRLSRALDRKPTARLAKAQFERQLESAGRKRITLVCTWCDSFKPSDAKNDFKDVPDFSATYTKLFKKTEGLSREASKSLSPEERTAHRKRVETAKHELNEFCRRTLNEEMPKRLSQKYCEVVKENVDLKSFLVASISYQEMADLDAENDEADKTQIPQLKRYCMGIPVEQRAYLTTSFIESDFQRVYSSLGLFLTSINTTLSPETLDEIRIDLRAAEAALKKDLIQFRETCIQAIYKDIDEMIEQVGKLAENVKADSWRVLQSFRQKYKRPITFRAVCRRGGSWVIRSEPGKDLNERLLDKFNDEVYSKWKFTCLKMEQSLDNFKIDSVRRLGGFQIRWEGIHPGFSRDFYVDKVTKMEVEVTRVHQLDLSSTDYEATKKHFVASLDCLSRCILHKFRTDVIKKAKRKGRVLYAAISSETVKSILEGCYAEVANIGGKYTYDRMVNKFLKGLADNDPFKGMGYEISSHLRELKEELNQETKNWCDEFEKELRKTVLAWTKRSKKSGQIETQEKGKLRRILADFEVYKDELIEEAKRLELEAQT